MFLVSKWKLKIATCQQDVENTKALRIMADKVSQNMSCYKFLFWNVFCLKFLYINNLTCRRAKSKSMLVCRLCDSN